MMHNVAIRVAVSLAVFLLAVAVLFNAAYSQTLDKMRLGYSGTGLNNYVLEIGRRGGIFRKNGLDLEIVYVNSGSLLNQALIAGTFDISFSQGSEAMMAKLRGADMRITAVVANRFNHVYLTAPAITSIKQLKGKKVAVSRFGSGSHFQSNLALKEGGLDPEKDVTILQIGNSAARMAAILSGTVDGTIMAADFVPKAKKEGFNIVADLADTKIEYPFLSLNFMGSYIDRNLKMVKIGRAHVNSSHSQISYAVFCLKKKNHDEPDGRTSHRQQGRLNRCDGPRRLHAYLQSSLQSLLHYCVSSPLQFVLIRPLRRHCDI